MVVIEALREGCPVIAASETPWSALATMGAGETVDFEEPAAAAAALSRAWDPDTRARRSVCARQAFLREFEISAVAPRFAEWYEQVARRQPPARSA